MEDAEKLTALKRAYADIILNTAKEAAARVMASDRRASRFQQELCAAKEESLRMLLRLKQMMDFKVKEAESLSLTQHKKIDELEAQLQEAEDIVNDLREELRLVQAELEKVRDKRLQNLGEQDLKSDPATVEGPLRGSRLESLASVMFQSDPRSGLTTPSILKSSPEQRHGINKCYAGAGSLVDVRVVGQPDFASIIMRNKEPELYKNGCTQRVRAYEGKLLDGKMSHQGQEDDEKNETSIGEMEGKSHTNMVLTSRTESTCGGMPQFKEPQPINSCPKAHPVNYLHRKRKRTARYKNLIVSPSRCIPKKLEDIHQGSDNLCSKTFSNSLTGIASKATSDVEESDTHVEHDLCLPLKSPSDTTEIVQQSTSMKGDETVARILKPCPSLNEIRKNEPAVDNLVLTRSEGVSSDCSVAQVETDVPLADPDKKVSDSGNRFPGQSRDDKFLKYTFTRKRKKVALGSPSGSVTLDESASKEKAAEKENGDLEPQKTSLTVESSRDGRRLAQVARQLISLSEKKW